ncbi:NAD(P)-dependent alcohol dehydrogenase [Virgisporangium ochraceum]|uniref:NADPH:quinone reductase n=1 Tax=Virgisporangium ochraceum TaxID=65505 RepID=A0A8J4A954_9ACTN|nr:NAD(P)-dependent alcohol dehydrogenase [Virgisporangium ochraceum]GIJ75276.1 NADPH:quinone reductase [Virgisporangium ochraceum]
MRPHPLENPHPGARTHAVPRTNRAITQTRYGGPEVLRMVDQPPPAPGPGEVLIRVHAASVNARDWHVMRGEPRLARLIDRTVLALRGPRIPVRGTDLAGVVAAVGAGVAGWAPGDAVYGEGVGTFADYAVAAAAQLAALPKGMPFEDAAALPLAATTALLCLDETGLGAGGAVLINGASGGVGTMAVQAAKAMGFNVSAVVSTRNMAMVESLGADTVIDYTTTDFTRTGRTWDAVVDLVGNHRLRDLRRTVRPGGRLVLSGGGNPGEGRILGPLKLLVGATALARFQPFQVCVPQAVPSTEMLERIARMVADGRLRPVVDKTFALPDVPAAVRYMEAEQTHGKVIITTS